MIKKFDYILLLCTFSLAITGVFFVYSSSIDIGGELRSSEFVRQVAFLILGMGLFFCMQLIPLQKLRKYSLFIYVLCMLLLILTLVIGKERNGAKSWLGIWNFGIQVSEFMKIGTILFLASMIENKRLESIDFQGIVQGLMIVGVPLALILLQPDMGTALVYIPIILAILYVSGVSAPRVFFVVAVCIIAMVSLIVLFYLYSADVELGDHVDILALSGNAVFYYLIVLFGLVILSIIGMNLSYFQSFFRVSLYISSMLSIGTLLTVLAIKVLKPYQLQRLLIFVNPNADPQDTGWHVLQSIGAIGSGGIFGLGFLQGTQSKLQYLPMAQTDFIFSVIGEELGFLGTGLVVLAYTVLMWRVLITGYRSTTMFGALCCSGVFAMFFAHFTVNIGMTIGFMPVTGIPLMLLSYGGSSLWTALIALGIIHNIHYNETRLKGRVMSTF